MEGREISPTRARARHGALGACLLALWGAVLLCFFTRNLGDLFGPTVRLLETLGLIALSLYSMVFLGWRIRRGTRLSRASLPPLDLFLVELALGAGAFCGALFVAGIAGAYSSAAAWLLLVLPLAGRHRPFFRDLSYRWARRRWHPSFTGGLAAAVGALTLFESLAPATSQDALVYHLAVPKRFIEEGRLHYVEGNFYSAFPMNVEMLFTWGLLLGSESLAKWYHWMFGAAAVLTVAALARAVGCGAEREASDPAPLGAALFATVPSVALIAGWAYVDLAVVFFTALSVLLLVRYREALERTGGRQGRELLLLAAIAAGLAAGCKYTGGIQIVLVAVAAFWVARRAGRPRRSALKGAAAALALGCICVSPWLLKNLAFTGNPLFPFAYSVFGGADWDAHRAAVLAASLREWGGGSSHLLALPWDLSVGADFFSQEEFDGVIGCAFLLGAPFLVRGRRAPLFRLAFGFFLLHALFWIATTHQVRFLLPALAIAAALLAASVPLPRGRFAWGAALLGLPMVLNVVLILIHFAAHNPLPVVLGFEDEERYRAREVPGEDYALFRYANENLPDGSRLLLGSCGNPGYLLERSYRSDALFENFTLARLLRETATGDELAERLRAEGYTHLLFRFDCVFDPSGRRSEIPPDDQLRLAEFLNRRARLEYRAGPTVLYALEPAAKGPGGVEEP